MGEQQLTDDYMGDEAILEIVDTENSSLVSSLIVWKYPYEHIAYCSGEGTEKFRQEIPLLDEFIKSIPSSWLYEFSKSSFIVSSSLNEEEEWPLLSSGFRMTPSYIRSSLFNDSNEMSEKIYSNNYDFLFRFDLVQVDEQILVKMDRVSHQKVELVDEIHMNGETNDLLSRETLSFESSILRGELLSKQTEFIIPCSHEQEIETPIILIGYPDKPSKAYLRNTYQNPPEKKEFNAVFNYLVKTASIGKIKSSNSNILIVSNATCYGMSGSPVFSLKGELIGFLLGCVKCFTYNNAFVLSVNHPSVVIEYLSFAGHELLITEKDKYLPLLSPYISKHYDLIMKAIDSNIVKESMKENLRRVLDIYQQLQ